MSDKIYVKLKDTGGTFNDAEQGVNIVSNRIGEFKPTARVLAAIKGGALVKLEDQKQAAIDFAEQELNKPVKEPRVHLNGIKKITAAVIDELKKEGDKLQRERDEEFEEEYEQGDGGDGGDKGDEGNKGGGDPTVVNLDPNKPADDKGGDGQPVGDKIPAEPAAKPDYNAKTVPELKALIATRNLDATGCTIKQDFIAILEIADEQEANKPK